MPTHIHLHTHLGVGIGEGEGEGRWRCSWIRRISEGLGNNLPENLLLKFAALVNI